MRNLGLKIIKLTFCFLFFTFFSLNSASAQWGDDWDWYLDTIDFELPCDSLIQFECNGETIEFSVCEIDWEALEDCFWDYDDWDWDEDSIYYDDWDYNDWDDFDWDWFIDTIDFELPCDSLIQFDCNGETLEFSVCEIDWEALEDCFWDNYGDDWDWDEDSIYYGDWDDFDWDWYIDTIDFELPCDSLIQFDCNGETLEFSVCEIDWEALEDCFWDNYDDDWDWDEDSIYYGDWDYDDWDWDEDSIDFELPCDSLIQFECNGETLEFSVCEIDWEVLEDCFWDYYDWDWNEDSLYYGDWDYDDWDWYGDSLDFELPCDSLIQFECNGETLEFSVCEIDWEALEDCFWDYDDWDWNEDSLYYGDRDYDDWDWYEDSLDFELPCDSLVQFECNGETLEFSVCEIDWELLEDCFGATLENDDSSEQNITEDGIEESEDKGEVDNVENPVISEIYPNPVVNSLYINVVTTQPQIIEIAIFDTKGGVVHLEEVAIATKGKFVLPINFETRLAKGMYQLNIINANKQVIKTQSIIVAQ